MVPRAAHLPNASSDRTFGPRVEPGEIIAGRYRVVRQLGEGGMGQVLEVQHIELERSFAAKLIRPDRWDDHLESRFRREVRALARIRSPRVAQVTDFGVDPDRGPYYVMELVDGKPLDRVLEEQGPLSRERALEVATGIADALVDVHAAGIVHRDIKPSNVGLCRTGPISVRLLDFGLAATMDDAHESGITESRAMVGSLPYMAPEQFSGERPTQRMDLWALGVVLCETIRGRLPFEAPSTAALIHTILTSPRPVLDRPGSPLDTLLDGLLHKDEDRRFGSAEDAAEALRRTSAAVRAQGGGHRRDAGRFAAIDDSGPDTNRMTPDELEYVAEMATEPSSDPWTRRASAGAASAASAETGASTTPSGAQARPARRGRLLAAALVLGALGIGAALLAWAMGGAAGATDDAGDAAAATAGADEAETTGTEPGQGASQGEAAGELPGETASGAATAGGAAAPTAAQAGATGGQGAADDGEAGAPGAAGDDEAGATNGARAAGAEAARTAPGERAGSPRRARRARGAATTGATTSEGGGADNAAQDGAEDEAQGADGASDEEPDSPAETWTGGVIERPEP